MESGGLLSEARGRLYQILIISFSGLLAGWFASDWLISNLKSQMLPAGASLIVLNPLEYVVVKVKISLAAAFLLLFFFALLILFRKYGGFFWPFLASSAFFLFGTLLAYSFLLPMFMKGLTGGASVAGVSVLYSLDEFISFSFFSIALVGLAFEFPLLLFFLVSRKIIGLDVLASKRRVIYFGIVLFATLLPDPTPVTQIFLSAILIILFELSMLAIRLFGLS